MKIFNTQTELNAALDLAPLEPGAFRFAAQFTPAGFVCDDCGETKPFPLAGCGTGYARCDDKPNAFVCYACCGVRDARDMRANGRAVLYLTHGAISRAYPYADGQVSNWPGTLKIAARVKRGAHNIARYRYDAWFTFDGAQWHGVQIGDNSQIIRCKRLKR